MVRPRHLMELLAAAAFAASIGPAWAGPAALACQSGKNKAAGTLATCRHSAYAKYALTGDATKLGTDVGKCATRYDSTWAKLEAKSIGEDDFCPTLGDGEAVRTFVEGYTGNVAGEVTGGPPIDGLQGLRVRTGQTQCWNEAGASIPCAGTGQDGELQRGLSPFYLDLGQGWILDTRTGLTWEKQSDDGSVHDRDNKYTWTDGFTKVASLNAEGFGGYADWRVPNVNELHTLVSYATSFPATPFAFNAGCTPGCTAQTCSCSAPGLGFYWMSDTAMPGGGRVWALRSDDGTLFTVTPTATYAVRAVRGGF